MSTAKPIRYRVVYLGSSWCIEIENTVTSPGNFIMVHKPEQIQRVDKFGSIEYIYQIEKFNTQKEAYTWIEDNLDPNKSEEYVERTTFFGCIKRYLDSTIFSFSHRDENKVS